LEKEDYIDNLPIAKRLVYVLLHQTDAKFPEMSHSLALPLNTKLYKSILEPKETQETNNNNNNLVKQICK